MLPRKREVVAGEVEDLQKKTRAEEELNKADDSMAWRAPEIDEDLHSRQFAGYGRETMKHLFGSNVLVSGLQGHGAEIESSRRQQDLQWLATLSETELDLLISLKELATMRAKNAGHPRLADKFDLRTLRALGIVLLESFKERLKETSVDPNFFDKLTLLSDSDADFTNSGSDSKVVRPNEDQQSPIGVMRKRKQMQDGQEERKTSERRSI